jgi:phage tail-like protein
LVTPDGDNVGEGLGAFVTCTLPEVTLEVSEYCTGMWPIKKKFPGQKSYNNITLTRGVVKNRSELLRFIMAPDEFSEYRIDVIITQHHRDGSKIVYTLENAFASRYKLAGDLDANSSDISMQELDLDFEEITVTYA